MTRFLTVMVSALALLGLAACSDVDDTTTRSVEPEQQDVTPLDEPNAAPETPLPEDENEVSQ